MTLSPSRILIAGAFLPAILMIGAALSVLRLRSSSAAAETAEVQLEKCIQLAGDIKGGRAAAALDNVDAPSDLELTERIQEALEVSRIGNSAVGRIDPQPSRRLGKSDYEVQETQIHLLSVALKPLVSFLLSLGDKSSGFAVSHLRLTAVGQGGPTGSEERWNAEATLTRIVFAPIIRPPRPFSQLRP